MAGGVVVGAHVSLNVGEAVGWSLPALGAGGAAAAGCLALRALRRWALRIFFAFCAARVLALVRDLTAVAIAVAATSVTETSLGSPLPEAQKPNAVTLLLGAIDAAQLGAATVTMLPLLVAVPLQLSVILTLDGSVKFNFQLRELVVPALAILKLRHRPPVQVESFVTVAVNSVVPGAGVGPGAGAGAGAGVGTGVSPTPAPAIGAFTSSSPPPPPLPPLTLGVARGPAALTMGEGMAVKPVPPVAAASLPARYTT